LNFRATIQKELDTFFKLVDGQDYSIRKVTKGAFSQARSKIDFLVFKRLNKVAADTFYEKKQCIKWHNFRLLAVDGSRVQLPNHESIKEEFGTHLMGPKADSCKSLGLISVLYDVLNLITLDASIGKYADSERDHLINHLERTEKGDLLLLDRGYPCFWLLFLMKAKGLEFCVRLKGDWWNLVNEFSKEPGLEKIVHLNLPRKDKGKLSQYPHYIATSIQVRLIKVILSTGETEILCTSLLDKDEYKREEFKALYNKRWVIEEDCYKMLKCRTELENWSGKTALSVKQDFHAKILLLTILAAYKHPIEEKVKEEFKKGEGRKYDQQLNNTFALSVLREGFIGIFIKKQLNKVMDYMDQIIYKTREIIRPNRNNERKKKPKQQWYSSYKHY
jgi:hypothetical protein